MSPVLYNTLTRRKEPLQPLEPGRVTMYCCGVTVYDYSHLGHARCYVVWDTLRRYLQWRGYDVHYVQNFTDIDDKILNRAKEEGSDMKTVAERYTAAYFEDMARLNVLEADDYTYATRTLDGIQRLISELEQKGYAYPAHGDVYYAVRKFEGYGKLSGRKLEDMQAGASGRVSAEEAIKQDPFDFALWKGAKAGEPFWESPWGPGRPGWHIECSAMSLRHLGEQIDIHGGGNDLIFPHHENEIAQTESMTGKSFARYWMHNGMLQLAGEKMSKSLGNLITIDDFLNKHSSDALRILIYSGHYRKPVVYNDETLTAAQRVLTRLLTALRPGKGPKTTGEEVDTLREATENARANFITAMDDDFNTSTGMAAIFELVRAINSARDAGVSGPFFSAAQQTLRELTGVLGLTLTEETNEGTGRGDVKPFVDLLVNIRTELRTAKQWALADKVRNGLKEHGVVIEDTPEGPVWRFGE